MSTWCLDKVWTVIIWFSEYSDGPCFCWSGLCRICKEPTVVHLHWQVSNVSIGLRIHSKTFAKSNLQIYRMYHQAGNTMHIEAHWRHINIIRLHHHKINFGYKNRWAAIRISVYFRISVYDRFILVKRKIK